MSQEVTPAPSQWNVVDALDTVIDGKLKQKRSSSAVTATTAAEYEKQRQELQRREGALGFEHKIASAASPDESTVNAILQNARLEDDKLFKDAPTQEGYNGQQHPRFAGDHFLSNKTLIDECKVYRIARRVPKGAHLHIHFNACLQPKVLLDIAKDQPHMYIFSDLPLLEDRNYHNLKRAKIQFSILTRPEVIGDLFDAKYQSGNPHQFADFLKQFQAKFSDRDAMKWLQEKLVFQAGEAHNTHQTVEGAWDEFNTRTKMMKGLFNYKSAYKAYTRKCLEDFVADNIQYAEIRPNFMDANQVWEDDGSAQINNEGIMNMIIDEVERFQKENPGHFGGLKIIYCFPRSFAKERVAFALRQCLEFKKKWPKWIAGKLR